MEPMFVEFANSLVWWAGSIEALDAVSFCLDLECFDCVFVCGRGGAKGVYHAIQYKTKQCIYLMNTITVAAHAPRQLQNVHVG